MAAEPEYVVVPVVQNFDLNCQVGELKVLKWALPPEANYVFSLGTIQPYDPNAKQGQGAYDLGCVSIVSDVSYLGYLQQIGVANDYKAWYDEAMNASNAAGFVGLTAAETIAQLDLERTQWRAREMQMLDSIERTEMILNGADPAKLP